MVNTAGFAAVFYSEPAVLGLLANVVSAFLLCLQNFTTAHTGLGPQGVQDVLAGVHLILIGGFVQLLAGFLAFRKYDHLGGAAFLTFSALWSSYGATRIISAAYPPLQNTTLPSGNASHLLPAGTTLTSTSQSAVAGLVAYISISFILSFCSATVNYIMPFIFGAIALALVFEAVALFGQWALVVSGVIELVIVLCGLYGAVALLLKGVTQRYILPGFGHPLFNVLLLGSAQKSSSKAIGEEKKKNTKYAEPMALGNICDTVSPFIFAFYSFGYMKTFCVGAAWISIISSCQLLSSFYSYLRGDVYYTTKFGVHSLYWLVMSWEEFILTVLLGPGKAQESRLGMFGGWFFLAVACMLFLMSTHKDTLEMLQNASFIILMSASIHQIPVPGAYLFLGAACSLCTALSLYATFASLINSIGEKALIPIGSQAMSSSALQTTLMAAKSCFTRSKNLPSSTRAEVPDALFYICNGLAAISAIQATFSDPDRQQLSIPSVLIPGAIMQLYVCRIQVQGGRRFGCILPFCYAAFWGAWTWLRFAGHLMNIGAGNSEGFTAGAIAFLVLNAFLMILASSLNVVLLCMTAAMELLAICFLLFTLENLPLPFEIVMLSIFSIICFYGATASLANSMFGKDLMMMGPPLFTAESSKKDTEGPPPCICPKSHCTSGLRAIADLLNTGAVCGVPTDTVYALAASCRHPQAIEKVYRIKDRPQEKPICIFISNLDQLRAAAPPISPLLWEFMENVYPGGIGCIIKKGEWLKKLGVGEGYSRVGTQDSIMIRVPDLTVLVHLIDMTGPLAITSANPSGEVDSTHHDMVISRLGHKLEGVLCDGDSDEVVASTVVNCTKIDESGITIIREGCIPAGKVMQIFERVKNRVV
uniref:Threonylcarbamoyl-AMP synthase n=1 Tax=Anser brachyrhynchus TaxID=132585 RepID=A0A8B9CRQ4_9AVES